MKKQYKTTSKRQHMVGERLDPVPPGGNGWDMCGSAVTNDNNVMWFWVRAAPGTAEYASYNPDQRFLKEGEWIATLHGHPVKVLLRPDADGELEAFVEERRVPFHYFSDWKTPEVSEPDGGFPKEPTSMTRVYPSKPTEPETIFAKGEYEVYRSLQQRFETLFHEDALSKVDHYFYEALTKTARLIGEGKVSDPWELCRAITAVDDERIKASKRLG
jgi:hypothetical protein